MKTNTVKYIQLLIIGISFLSSCKHTDDGQLPNPQIKMGISKIFGKYINPNIGGGDEKPTFTLRVPNPITAELTVMESQLDSNNNFSFEVYTELDPAIAYLQVSNE